VCLAGLVATRVCDCSFVSFLVSNGELRLMINLHPHVFEVCLPTCTETSPRCDSHFHMRNFAWSRTETLATRSDTLLP